MTLIVDLTPEEEAQLAEAAKKRGVSVDAFVKTALREMVSDGEKKPGCGLPEWTGSVIGGLRRKDIYEDA